MQKINIGRKNTIEPIEWKSYTGETIVVNTVIRQGKKIQETAFYEDRVKAVPRGNAYCVGNGPSSKGLTLTNSKHLDRHMGVMLCTETLSLTSYSLSTRR